MSLTTTQDIITKFELFIGDETELSSDEELDLLQKCYNKVLASAEWEFLKTEATGPISGMAITVPADFDRLTTDQKIYLGTAYNPFTVIPFTERRSYLNNNAFVYYNAVTSTFNFMLSQSDVYSFDYIFVPPTLDLVSSNPIFPIRFYDMLYHAMCIDSDIINLSDKARSYARENTQKYESILNDMRSWNMKLSGFNTYGI